MDQSAAILQKLEQVVSDQSSIKTSLEFIKEKVDKNDQDMNGNGKKGIKDRMTAAETKQDARDKHVSRIYTALTGIVAAIVGKIGYDYLQH